MKKFSDPLNLPFIWNVYKQNLILLGEPQSGKTNAGKVIAKILQLNGFNVIIRDVHRRFGVLDPSCIKKNLYDLRGNQGLEIWQPENDSKQAFIDFCAWARTLYNCHVMIDELHNDANSKSSNEHLEFLLRNCNNRSVSTSCIFQRFREVPKMVLHTSKIKICFRYELPEDVQWLRKWIGSEVDRFISTTDPIEKYHCLIKLEGQRAFEEVFPNFD